ncbi:MAG: DUF2304 domain-containing protein [Candidatus Eisenbacteria bacterium]|nr:DUF2304 domain-containing protein [Candidatus Eisenbacteria bacterium]
MSQIQIVSIGGSLALLLIILELIRKGKLAEEYSLLWIATGAVLLLLSIWRGILDAFARVVGVYYPPSALFLVGFGFMLLLILHFSIVLSRLTRNNRNLAQTVALLERKLEEREEEKRGGGSHGEDETTRAR